MAKNEPTKPDDIKTAPANETPKEQTAPVSEPLAADKQAEAPEVTADKAATLPGPGDDVERYTDFTDLTQIMLHEFIEKVVVHERDYKGAIDSPQTVEIHLNYIGEFMPLRVAEEKELTPEEQAEQEEIMKRRERYRRAYEQRVANGSQKKYYERTKYKKRAEHQAIKETLFDERYTLGESILPQTATN